MKPPASQSRATRPWSPLSVSIITFLLPAGGAVLTVQNLARLREGDPPRLRWQTAGVVVIYAVGLAIILALAPIQAGVPRLDDGTYTIIQVGFAIAAYAVQRAPFRAWALRQASGTSAWTSGVLTALVYQIVAILLTVPVYAGVAVLVFAGVSGP